MEINRKLLSSNRKTRTFRANFERMMAIVQFNKILLLTTGEFRVIDVSGIIIHDQSRFSLDMEGRSRL